jgi:hypothetical protein
MKLIQNTFFLSRPVVGGIPLFPLTGGRVAILAERGNPVATGREEKPDPFAVYECFFVASQEGRELAKISLDSPEAWRERVRAFALEVEDDALNEFWEILQGEIEAVRRARVEPVGKPDDA